MNKQEFDALVAQGHTHIPITRELIADMDTPLSVYLKLANAPYTYLFESVHGGEKWGRYSFIGLPCKRVVKITGNTITISVNGNVEKTITSEDPLEWVQNYQTEFKVAEPEGLPRFAGGLVGYFWP